MDVPSISIFPRDTETRDTKFTAYQKSVENSVYALLNISLGVTLGVVQHL